MGEVRDGDVLTEQGEPRAVEVRDEENEEGGRDASALCLGSRTHAPARDRNAQTQTHALRTGETGTAAYGCIMSLCWG